LAQVINTIKTKNMLEYKFKSFIVILMNYTWKNQWIIYNGTTELILLYKYKFVQIKSYHVLSYKGKKLNLDITRVLYDTVSYTYAFRLLELGKGARGMK